MVLWTWRSSQLAFYVKITKEIMWKNINNVFFHHKINNITNLHLCVLILS